MEPADNRMLTTLNGWRREVTSHSTASPSEENSDSCSSFSETDPLPRTPVQISQTCS